MATRHRRGWNLLRWLLSLTVSGLNMSNVSERLFHSLDIGRHVPIHLPSWILLQLHLPLPIQLHLPILSCPIHLPSSVHWICFARCSFSCRQTNALRVLYPLSILFFTGENRSFWPRGIGDPIPDVRILQWTHLQLLPQSVF